MRELSLKEPSTFIAFPVEAVDVSDVVELFTALFAVELFIYAMFTSNWTLLTSNRTHLC